jgi:hypothetical protein
MATLGPNTLANAFPDQRNPQTIIELITKGAYHRGGLVTTVVSQPRMSSFNARVAELVIGECAAKIRTVDNTCSVERLPAELPAIREQARNATTPAVTRAKQLNPGATYSIEVGDWLSPRGRLFVIAVVTRES